MKHNELQSIPKPHLSQVLPWQHPYFEEQSSPHKSLGDKASMQQYASVLKLLVRHNPKFRYVHVSPAPGRVGRKSTVSMRLSIVSFTSKKGKTIKLTKVLWCSSCKCVSQRINKGSILEFPHCIPTYMVHGHDQDRFIHGQTKA